MTKIHLQVATGLACHRYQNSRTRVGAAKRVTCLDCRKAPVFDGILAAEKAAHDASVAAQEPTPVMNPWSHTPITCRFCGNGTFRYAGRSLDTHNHLCANCGETSHTLTETGMSA